MHEPKDEKKPVPEPEFLLRLHCQEKRHDMGLIWSSKYDEEKRYYCLECHENKFTYATYYSDEPGA